MTGQEALGRGAWDAGVSMATGYPGAPVTQALETVIDLADRNPGECYAAWTASERMALDLTIGASLAGRRALFVTKSVGFNTVIDELQLVNLTGVNGGLVILLGDDPLATGSQNNQDTRLLVRALELPIIEPANPLEGYLSMIRAFEVSERYSLPVVVRIVRDFARMQQEFFTDQKRQPTLRSDFPKEARNWLSAPPLVEERHGKLHEKLHRLSVAFESWPQNSIKGADSQGTYRMGLAAVGQCQEKLDALDREYCDLERYRQMKLSTCYPLPGRLVAEFCYELEAVLVFEEGEPFVEEQFREFAQRRNLPIQILGRRTGTLPDKLSLSSAEMFEALQRTVDGFHAVKGGPSEPPGPARLSEYPIGQGCPFHAVFQVFRQCMDEDSRGIPWVVGEPGCNVRLKLPPFDLFDYRVAMGSAIGVASGLAQAGCGRRTVAVVGDSAFVHGGLTPLVDAARKDLKALVLIMDNKVLGVTGCQPGPTGGAQAVDLVRLCEAGGARWVTKVTTSEPSRLRQIFRESLAADDLRVIVLEYPCSRCVDPLKR